MSEEKEKEDRQTVDEEESKSDAKEEALEKSKDSDEKQDFGPDYSYDPSGTLIYTNPESKQQFVLNEAKTDWVPKDGSSAATPAAAEKDKYDFDGETYSYKDDATGKRFKWDLEKKEWKEEDGDESEESEMSDSGEDEKLTEEEREKKRHRKRRAAPGWGKQGKYETDPSTGEQLYRDGSGMLYEWDSAKKAWFPRIDDDFMAQYQMNYGFTKDGVAEPTRPDEPKPEEEEEPKAKKAKIAETAKAKWFEEDETKTTKVYVSNLPSDTTEDSFVELMSKCGMVDVDVRTNKPKIKLYRDAEGGVKGDGLCTYVKVESVGLALQILDGSRVGKGNNELKVERAKFEMKGEKYDPKLKPRKLRKKELEALKKKHDKMFEWVPDKLRGQRSKKEKVVVLRSLFDPREFDEDASRILEYSSRLREHCAKFGRVTKVVVYDKHEEGVAQIFFGTPEEADMAISMMNGRIFSGKKVMKAATWDGKEKFKVAETEEEERERLANWDKFLNEGDEAGDVGAKGSSAEGKESSEEGKASTA